MLFYAHCAYALTCGISIEHEINKINIKIFKKFTKRKMLMLFCQNLQYFARKSFKKQKLCCFMPTLPML